MHRHLDTLNKLITFIQSVHRQVRFKTEPLRKILHDLSESDDIFSFEQAANENIVGAFLTQLKKLDVSDEVVVCIQKCFDNLQISDTDSACEELLLCIDRLCQIKEEFEQTVKVKSGMYLKLGFLAAAFIAVIMI